MISANEMLESLNWRYATKSFDANRKIPTELWEKLEEVLLLSPSSFGIQLWSFHNVSDPAVREQLKAASWNQPQITDASNLVVFAAKKTVTENDIEKFILRISKVRNVEPSSIAGYKDQMLGWLNNPAPGFDAAEWTAKQTYVALGFFLSACANLKIDSCPMEGINSETYNKILGLDQLGFSVTMVATAGYRSANDKYATQKKVRYDKSEIIHQV